MDSGEDSEEDGTIPFEEDAVSGLELEGSSEVYPDSEVASELSWYDMSEASMSVSGNDPRLGMKKQPECGKASERGL